MEYGVLVVWWRLRNNKNLKYIEQWVTCFKNNDFLADHVTHNLSTDPVVVQAMQEKGITIEDRFLTTM